MKELFQFRLPYGNENSAQFIAKFDSNLENIIWQTTIGSELNFRRLWTTFDFNPDVCKKIYISGFSAIKFVCL